MAGGLALNRRPILTHTPHVGMATYFNKDMVPYVRDTDPSDPKVPSCCQWYLLVMMSSGRCPEDDEGSTWRHSTCFSRKFTGKIPKSTGSSSFSLSKLTFEELIPAFTIYGGFNGWVGRHVKDKDGGWTSSCQLIWCKNHGHSSRDAVVGLGPRAFGQVNLCSQLLWHVAPISAWTLKDFVVERSLYKEQRLWDAPCPWVHTFTLVILDRFQICELRIC